MPCPFRFLLLLPAIGLAAVPAEAQRSRFRVDSWTTDDGLPSSFISDMAQTGDGYLWLAAGGSLVRFDGFTFRVFNAGTDSALTSRVNTTYAGAGDTLWMVLDDRAVVWMVDGRVGRLTRLPSNAYGLTGQDRTGALVIRGTVSYRWERGRFVRVSRAPEIRPGGAVSMRGLLYDRARDQVLTVRRTGALAQIVDRTGVIFAAYRAAPGIDPVLVDRGGRLWARAPGGLNVYAPGRVEPLEHIPFTNWRDLAHVIEDREGNIWLGGTGLVRIQEIPFRTVTRADIRQPSDLQVERLTPGPLGSVLVRPAHGRPGVYRFDDSSAILLDPRLGLAAADGRGTVWFSPLLNDAPISGRLESGVVLALPRRGGLLPTDDPAHPGSVWFFGDGWLFRAEPYAPGGPRVADSLRFVGSPGKLVVARDGAIWVVGLDSSRQSRLTRFESGGKTTWTPDNGLPRASLRDVLPDSDGTVWLGTYGAGLVRLRNGRFQAVRAQDGLAEDVVSGILEDDAGNFWMGGNRGVHRVARAEAEAFLDGRAPRVNGITYGRADGLLQPETSGNLGTRDAAGKLWFPTFGGAVVVDPARALALDSTAPLVHILGLGVAGHDSLGGRLPRGERRLEIAYTAISLRDPAGVRFAYRMEGVDRDWIHAGASRVAVYNNIRPGEHTFRVRAVNRGGVPARAEATVAFVVPAYFRETVYFSLLVATLLAAGVLGAWRLRTRQLRRRQAELHDLVEARTHDLGRALSQVEAQAAQLKTLDEAKSRFFANVSHEFRTPLSLVLGPLEDMRDGRSGPLPDLARKRIDNVIANGRRLVQLVEQLLDVARLESGTLHLNAEVHDLVPLLRRVSESFASMAERRGIGFRVACPVGGLRVRFDSDQMEKVITNILGNALKFTPSGGRVELRAQTVSDEGGWAVVEVEDTGPGIAGEHLPRVFDRFYQVDDSPRRAHEGAGIGLALAKELVDLHAGTISVRSAPGQGSTFTVRLPLQGAEQRASDPVMADRLVTTGEVRAPRPSAPAAAAAPGPDVTTVLVVEDNAELRDYLKDHLADRYRVLEAGNGLEALALAREHVPDLIVSDVMMPEMDGQSLCSAVKADPEIDFIPVILLTAKASRESRLQGLEGGADDYLAKPVDIRELQVRSANLISSRRRLKERYQEANRELPRVSVPFQQGKWGNRSDALIRKLYETMAEHVGDEDFQVEQMASAVGMGRSTLYRRLEELLGRSPMDVLWDYRLEQAAQWLLETDANVSEIAYGVGFKSVPHFCAKFRERFGRTPTAYRGARTTS